MCNSAVKMSALSILAEECELLNDSKYRSYITQVDKALKSFEYTSEWADLISALGKLNKVLLANVKYPVIPKRVTIGKRLAQCLHPALPGGVHLKALETYDIIFKCIGTLRLAQDLFVYSAGLFPLLGHAAMNVKPVLLTIYEKHFVALGKHIKPGLNGLLLGLLPGLEEGSDFYDRTNSLMEDFCEAADSDYFYTCLWECILSCPSVRLPAITFLLSHYNKKQTMEDQLYMMGLNIDLMVKAVCHAVKDTVVLVQRVSLDFLLQAFPMHNGQLTKSDMAKIVKAAITVVLRRDMSLNRRLYSWLLGMTVSGSDVSRHGDGVSSNTEPEQTYFQIHSKELLIQALKNKLTEKETEEDQFKASTSKSSVLKPFRILMSLLDKPEIGPVILENVLLSVLQCLYRECHNVNSCNSSQSENGTEDSDGYRSTVFKKNKVDTDETFSELVKTANLLFGAFEPYFIWDYLSRMFEVSCHQSATGRKLVRTNSIQETDIPTLPELCRLTDFLLEIVSLETFLETQTEHLPDLLNRILASLTTFCKDSKDYDVNCTLQLCSKILSKILDECSKENGYSTFDVDDNVENVAKQNDAKNDLQENNQITSKSPSSQKKNINIDEKKSKRRGSDLSNSSFSRRFSMQKSKSSINLMQTSVECFQNFFHTFTTHRIFQEQNVRPSFMKQLSVPNCFYDEIEKDSSLLDFSADGHPESDVTSLSVDHLKEETVKTYLCACKLLVDFSSFPLYCTDYHKVLNRTNSKGKYNHKYLYLRDWNHTFIENFIVTFDQVITAEDRCLPTWLQDLIICGCFVDSFDIQSASISTLLDLIILTQSVQSDNTSTEEPSPSSPPSPHTAGTVSVVILPALLPRHLRYLNEKTHVYKEIAGILWSYLGDTTPTCHQRSVELFHMLHQITPSSLICEDVIGHSLVSDDQITRIEAFKKFTILWHLTRDTRVNLSPGQSPRTFDRSMFVLLDSLKEETSAGKTVASTWLTHVIQRGDISRVIGPLLLMLLHPDTARVSVQHVNIHQPRKVKISESNEENDVEARIYAISSDGGNIIYHVSARNPKISGKTAEDLKSIALTVMNNQGSTVTEHVKAEHEMTFERVKPSELNLQFNPFGSENSLDKFTDDAFDGPLSAAQTNLKGAKRLNKETCAKEGIYFDDAEVSETEEEVKTESSQDVVEALLNQIIEEVVLYAEGDIPADDKLNKNQNAKRSMSISSKNSSVIDDQEILNSIAKSDMNIDSPTGSEMDLSKMEGTAEDATGVHALHMHMLLYTQVYDYRRTIYAFTTLKSMLVTCPRLVVTSLVTTGISSVRTSQLAQLQLLLARHRKSVFGKNFFGELPPEVMSSYRSNMFIEVLISVCLYFVRSYYPNLMMSKLSPDELTGNKDVHILASEVLTLLISELITIMKESGKNFISYIKDLLTRCKLQKSLLHCCLASVYNMRQKQEKEKSSLITEAIISFNEDNLHQSANETFQIRLLNLLLVMIMLESGIEKGEGDSEVSTPSGTPEWERPKINFRTSLLNAKYNGSLPIVQQGMFASCVLSALKQSHLRNIHRHWIALITSALPFMGKSLSTLVLPIVAQLCRNTEALALEYEIDPENSSIFTQHTIPPDHVITVLEGLTTVCHYCLLDNLSPVSIGQPAPTSTTITTEAGSAGQILSNLINVFNPVGNREASPIRETSNIQPVIDVRRALLCIMPRIIACMTSLWRAVKLAEIKSNTGKNNHPAWTMGSPKVVRHHILEFLSPLSRPHGTHLLAAVGVAWNDRRTKTQTLTKKVNPVPCEDQLLLVDLVSAIKVLPTDMLVQTVKQVLKQPPATEISKIKKSTPLEVNMLQFFFAYVQQTSANHLVDSWSSILSLLREGQQLNLLPPGKFLLILILNEIVQKMPSMENKKNQKELQDITQKMLEMVGLIAGSSLEQTTWLRRNLAVKPGPQNETNETEDDDICDRDREPSVSRERKASDPRLTAAADSKYSVQALTLLAELTAPLLDVVYSSEEKDKVSPFLTTLMYNVFPYLRNHSSNNLPSYRACSQILASISGYQYTRKAWRKEAFELLLDSCFFQMDIKCIGCWRSIIDNLMTHDKTTFKDLIGRVSIQQTGSLNLFSSKEQELEQRAHMLKRLAFTIFCSDPDQYQKSMPEIQERLAENLRLPHQVPSIMAQVHVCLQIEQELSTDTDEFEYRWAFIGGAAAGEQEEKVDPEVKKKRPQTTYIPHIIRLTKLINNKLHGDTPLIKSVPGQPLITQTYIRSLSELQPFFNTLCQANQSDACFITSSQSGAGTKTSSKRTQKMGQTLDPGRTIPKSKSAPVFDKYIQNSGEDSQLPSPQKGTRQYIEYLLDRDFLEPLPL
ncbi:hypothetical protein KUTeg_007271 [Tegillarca granosa]|uniref:Protein dopey-1 n=1 Tax=Tegillarca granosa TaxID=220873 RepID=A0ABQ9FEQ4_TEGGR|nr:hypothetical protein KUTeg_007271 [Tegillarca granosa]